MKLIFVYNADSGFFSKLTDYAHKIISPQTYQCNLCAITYDNYGMKNEWKDFINSLPLRSEFLHKDEFKKQFPEVSDPSLPAVFVNENNKIKELITAKELNNQRTIEDLKVLVTKKVF